ncbi:hypothetical protein WR25_14486 [Diploscapter pachys]|uniref:Uncharacterized protein n=1 Tax=Diploscapter pachys TaxID=2018661 RepID=A0A2A2KY28_9BILA|nr:hypothetical protein WR25_14486 [Diploscapter pachys]
MDNARPPSREHIASLLDRVFFRSVDFQTTAILVNNKGSEEATRENSYRKTILDVHMNRPNVSSKTCSEYMGNNADMTGFRHEGYASQSQPNHQGWVSTGGVGSAFPTGMQPTTSTGTGCGGGSGNQSCYMPVNPSTANAGASAGQGGNLQLNNASCYMGNP